MMFAKNEAAVQSVVGAVESRFGSKVQVIVVPSSEKRALQYFGIKKKSLPAYVVMNVEPQGLEKFKAHLFDETCVPFCKIASHKGDGSEAAVVSFVAENV